MQLTKTPLSARRLSPKPTIANQIRNDFSFEDQTQTNMIMLLISEPARREHHRFHGSRTLGGSKVFSARRAALRITLAYPTTRHRDYGEVEAVYGHHMKKNNLIVIVFVAVVGLAMVIFGIFFIHDHPGLSTPLQTVAFVLGTLFTAITVLLALKVTREASRVTDAAAKLSIASAVRERTELAATLATLRRDRDRRRRSSTQYGLDGWDQQRDEADDAAEVLDAKIQEVESHLELLERILKAI